MLTHLECTRCDAALRAGPRPHRLRLRRAALRPLRPRPRRARHAARPPRAARADDVALPRGAAPRATPTTASPSARASRRCCRRRASARASASPACFVKDEGGNPTGSFKARGLAMAVSMAKALGATDVCAAVGRQRGQRARRLRGARRPARPRLPAPRRRARVRHGRGGLRRRGRRWSTGSSPTPAASAPRRAREHGWYECATLKEPYRVEGKKTMGYEIAEQMDWKLPDAILYPTGGGTGLVGMWKAFAEMEAMGFVGREAAADVRGPGRGLRADREGVRGGSRRRADLGERRRRSPTACACRRRSATS